MKNYSYSFELSVIYMLRCLSEMNVITYECLGEFDETTFVDIYLQEAVLTTLQTETINT